MGEGIRRTLNYRPRKERRKLIVLGTEGNNKTEYLYFLNLEKLQSEYHFVFAKSNNTDPKGIIALVAKESKKQGLNFNKGDISAAVFDLDLDAEKIGGIEEVKRIALEQHVDIYTSNPCFEVWYLSHFVYSTKPFTSNADVIKQLKKYIPEYEKNRCDFDILEPLSYKAIQNASQMQQSVKEVNNKICQKNNPNTDIFLLVEKVLPKTKKGGKKNK